MTPRRSAFSLIEVLLSMAIFLIALIGLSELLNISAHKAFDISQINKANQLLEDRMHAVLSGSVTLTGQSETTFDQDPDWVWSMDSTADGPPNLYSVTIHVRWTGGSDSDTWSLSRKVFDPAQRGTIESASSSSSSSSSPSSSPTTPSSGGK
jgi:prepilin-type N-terminal cleavage/methylation domain-containing protein